MALHHRVVNFFRRAGIARAIDDELRFHIEERVDELVAEGHGEAAARKLAHSQFGNATFYRERTRNSDVSQALEDLFDDAAYAIRSLRHTPVFTTAAILTLALGIGATTTIYGLVRAVWLRPLPYRAPDRVVRVWEKNDRLAIPKFSASIPTYMSWRERSASFESLVAVMGTNATLTGKGDPERVRSLAVTAGFFDALGISPVLGRAFTTGEDAPGHARLVMLSERLWRSRYARDPTLIGRTVQLNGGNSTVIGIGPADMGFSSDIDIWEPLTLDPARESRGNHIVVVMGRLKPGVSVAQAEAELNRLEVQLEREYALAPDWRVRVAPALDWIVVRETRTSLLALLIAVALLLVVACINVANLLLARATARVQEFGIRQALGAGHGRVIRQLVTESLVLASAGGCCGLLLAFFGVDGLRAILPADIPRAAQLSLDLPVLAAALGLTFATGLVFGLVPAWVAARLDVQKSIQQARGSSGAGRSRLRQALVAGEFALASMLVAGAGLLLADFQRLQSVDPGFQPRNVLTARISLPAAAYSYDRTLAFHRDLDRELSAAPGVQAAGIIRNAPFGGYGGTMSMGAAEDYRDKPQQIAATFQMATRGYFDALRIPLRRGRLFDERDQAPSAHSTILSEGLAHRLWPDGRDPIGRQVRFGDNPPATVVGVVADLRQSALAEDAAPTAYVASWFLRDFFVVIRAPGEPAQLAAALRRAVAKLDPAQPVFDVKPLEALLDANRAPQRLNALLTGSFALLALALGAVGVAGVVSYSVIRRTPEMAIRMALGATPIALMRTVVAGGLRVCLIGLLAGLAGAWALGRLITRLLYQVRPDSPSIFGAVALVLLGAALLSSWLPARKITRIDPIAALRKE